MTRVSPVAVLALTVFAPPARGYVTGFVSLDIDHMNLATLAKQDPAGVEAAEVVARLERGLMARDLAGIERVLGKPGERPAGRRYAMPLGQRLAYGYSGFHATPDRSHTEFYPVGEVG